MGLSDEVTIYVPRVVLFESRSSSATSSLLYCISHLIPFLLCISLRGQLTYRPASVTIRSHQLAKLPPPYIPRTFVNFIYLIYKITLRSTWTRLLISNAIYNQRMENLVYQLQMVKNNQAQRSLMGIKETLELVQCPLQSDNAPRRQSRYSQLLAVILRRQLALRDECFGITNNLF